MCSDGMVPKGLIQDASGNLYGTAWGGSAPYCYSVYCGTVFKLAPIITSITLSSSPNPSHVGQPVTLTTTVAGSYLTPTGTVTFKRGKFILGTVNLANGQANLTATFPKSGSYSLGSIYSGDQVYGAISSKRLKQVVE